MAIKIEMPKLSDTMEEGVIAKWNVNEGDAVSAGDIIAEVETDKATMDVEVFDVGTILKIVPGEGDAVPLGGLIAIIGEVGEDISSLLEDDSNSATTDSAPATKEDNATTTEKAVDAPAVVVAPSSGDGRIKASPLAKKIAADKGVDLHSISGSGPEGRIVKKDVETAQNATSSTLTRPGASVPVASSTAKSFASLASQEVKVSQMRKVIAKRLSESKFTNPHFYETIDIDMKAAIEARTQLKDKLDIKVSFNDIVVKAVALALKQHPQVNAKWEDNQITQHHHVHVGVAVAVEDGLVVPVVKFTDEQSLPQIGAAVKDYAIRARDKKLKPEEMEGSTFTISNLGMFGIQEFTSIINQPNGAILSVGAIVQKPVVKEGAIVVGNTMKLTLACDHRVVDGATGAQFLLTLRAFVENPLTMVV